MSNILYYIVFCALAMLNLQPTASQGTCKNIYEDTSCEIFQARSMCKMFQRYCAMTCGVCQPPTTGSPPTTTARFTTTSDWWPTTELPTTATEVPEHRRWSICTKTCGTGTQYRFVSRFCTNPNNPRCEREFRECNFERCFYNSCWGKMQSRYGDCGCCNKNGPGKNSVADKFNRGVNMEEVGSRDNWPWMVLVTAFSDICSGVLIHRQWVIVPGHCVTTGNNKINPRRISVYIGIKQIAEATARTRYSVRKIFVHPKSKSLQDDIALIQLQQTCGSKFAAVLSLPRGETAPIDSSCVVAGWGLSGISKNFGGLITVGHALQRRLDFGICRSHYSYDALFGRFVSKRSPKLLCAGNLSQRNPNCNGNVGSAMFCQRCSSCQWYLAGLSTTALRGSCDKLGYPTLFTRIRSHEQWIHKYIPELKERRLRCPRNFRL